MDCWCGGIRRRWRRPLAIVAAVVGVAIWGQGTAVVYGQGTPARANGVAGAGAGVGPVLERHGDVTIDWTRGLVIARAAAAASVRAPSPEIARIEAERRARAQALAKIEQHVRALHIAGRPVAEWVPVAADVADAPGEGPSALRAARLRRIIERARALRIEYESDGSVSVDMGVALEAVRRLVHGATAERRPKPWLVGDRERLPQRPPSAIVVDARRSLSAPRLGLVLRGEQHRYGAPTIFYRASARKASGSIRRSIRAMVRDGRFGDRVVRTRVKAVDDSEMVVELPDTKLAAAEWARAVVIVILGPS